MAAARQKGAAKKTRKKKRSNENPSQHVCARREAGVFKVMHVATKVPCFPYQQYPYRDSPSPMYVVPSSEAVVLLLSLRLPTRGEALGSVEDLGTSNLLQHGCLHFKSYQVASRVVSGCLFVASSGESSCGRLLAPQAWIAVEARHVTLIWFFFVQTVSQVASHAAGDTSELVHRMSGVL
eukprot:3514398-Amphidinium_carterae.1